jgi:hypothetical protein
MTTPFFAAGAAGPREPSTSAQADDLDGLLVMLAIADADRRFAATHAVYLACRCPQKECRHYHEVMRCQANARAIVEYSHDRARAALARVTEEEERRLHAEAEEEVAGAPRSTPVARAERENFLRERLGEAAYAQLMAAQAEVRTWLFFEQLGRVADRAAAARGETRRPLEAE